MRDPRSSKTTETRWLRLTGMVVAAVGFAVVAGWITGSQILTTFVPGGSPLVMNTAICLIVCGGGLIALAMGGARMAAVCGFLVAGFCTALLAQFFLGRSIGIDELFWKHQYVTSMTLPGRMAPHTAVALLLVGGSLLLRARGRTHHWLLPVMGGVIVAFALLPLLDFLSLKILSDPGVVYRGMAVPTAGCLILLGIAILRGTESEAGQESRAVPFLAAAFGMLVSIGVVLIQNNGDLIAANRLVTHTYEVRAGIDALGAELSGVEASARGYLLTGAEAFRTQNREQRFEAIRRLEIVKQLVADNPAQLVRVNTVGKLVTREFSGDESMMEAQKMEGPDAAAGKLFAARSALRANGWVDLVDSIKAEEAKLLLERTAQRSALERDSRTMEVLGSLIALGLMGAAVSTARHSAIAKKLAERSLVTANQLQRAVLDGTRFSVIASKLDGTIQVFNAGAEKMLGYTQGEMVGRRPLAALHVAEEIKARAAELSGLLGREIEAGHDAFVAQARLGRLDEREWTYVRKDGSKLPVLVSTTLLKDRSDFVTGFLSIAQDLTDHKRAEIALQASEERLHRVLSRADCLVWEANVTLTEADWNWSMTVHPSGLYRRLSGENDSSGSAGLWYQFEIPEREEMNRRCRAALEGGAPGYEQEFRLLREGQVSWIGETVSITRSGPGRFWLVGVAVDATENKRARAAHDEMVARLHKLGSLLPGMIYQFRLRPDGSSCFPYASGGIREIYRVAADEVRRDASKVFAVLHPDDVAAVTESIQTSARSLEPWQHEYRVRHADGTVRWLLGHSVPERESDGSVLWHGFITDVTQRKEAGKALAESEERFRQAFEFAGIGMAIVGLDGRWVRVNQAICEIVGYSATQLMEKTFQEITHPDDLNADLQHVRELLAGAVKVYQMEKRYIHRDGHVVWIHLTASLVRDSAGAPVHFVSQIEDVTVQKKLEGELRESEERVRLAASVAGVGVWELDLRTKLISWDARMFALYGVTPTVDGKVDYSVWAGALSPGERMKQEAMIREEMLQQRFSEREFPIQRYSDKARRIVQASKILIRSDSGEPLRIVGVNRDVTELRQNEAVLRSSEQRLSNIYRAMADGLVLQDAAGHIVECNPAAERILGLTREQLLGRSSLDSRWRTVHKDGSPCPADEHPAMVTLRTGRTVHNFEMGVWHPNGSLTWISINSEPLTVADAGVTEVICSFSDITERKKLEESVHRERELLRAVIDLLPSPIYLKDPDSRFLMVNQALAQCLGRRSPAQLVSLTDFDLFAHDVAAAFRSDDEAVLAGRDVRDKEETTLFPTGEKRTYMTTKVPFRDVHGNTTGILGIGVDITERKQLLDSLALARDEALEASRLKSEFLANMSHEIRTPMNGIVGMSDLLMDSSLDSDQREMGRVIQKSAENLLGIINDILDFSKIEAGKLRLEPVEMELCPVVDDAILLLEPMAEKKHLKLICDFDPGLEGVVLGDSGRIRQILLNLAGNAVKFTLKGEVAILVRRVEERAKERVVEVRIRDTGIGISAAAQKQLFQSFMQADGSTTRRFGGTGLGLAISRQLVELMGGEIGLTSDEGRGSTFWFRLTLPKVVRGAATVPPLFAVPRPRVSGRALNFLVAEDNETNQLVARGFLEKMGHRADFAFNGKEVLQMLPLKPYDALLMDCQMPEMDGYTAARKIREGAVSGANPAIPIIAVTAFAMASDRLKCLEAGMNDYLPKPLRADELQQALVRCNLVQCNGHVPVAAPKTADDVLAADHLSQLRELPGRQHPSLLEEVAGIFLRETPDTLNTLRHFAGRRAQNELAQLAHRLAGSAASIGGKQMQAAAHSVEQAASGGHWSEVAETLAKLDHEWQRVKSALEQLHLYSP